MKYALFIRILFLAIGVDIFFASNFLNAADNQEQLAIDGKNQNDTWNQSLLSLKNIIDKLSLIKVKEEDVDIPQSIRPLLIQLKHEMRDLILLGLNDGLMIHDEPDELKNKIADTLRKIVPLDKDNTKQREFYTYGQDIEIELVKPSGYSDLVVAITTIWVMCGSDSSLYLFKRDGQSWKLIAEQEANNYEDVSGAQEAFNYEISPRDKNGNFFVVTTSVNPWCVSNWQSIHYRVFRPGISPDEPQVLLDHRDTIYLGNENYGNIKVNNDSFSIEFDAGQNLDAGVLVRKHIFNYKIKDNQLIRVVPLAEEPEGFLDELFDMSWEDAANWVDESARPTFRHWYNLLGASQITTESDFYPSFTYYPPSCKLDSGFWQIGLDFSPHAGQKNPLPEGMNEVYFTVSLRDGGYFLNSIDIAPRKQCYSSDGN